MERKFIARLFINKAKETGKPYLKGKVIIPKEDIQSYISNTGELIIPVFGHMFDGKSKTDQEYKAFNLEVIQNEEDNLTQNQGFAKTINTQSKTTTKNGVDLPF